MRPSRRALWLLPPIFVVGAALVAVSTYDQFAEYARHGTPVSPETVRMPLMISSNSWDSWVAQSSEGAMRAWRLPQSPEAVARGLYRRGFSEEVFSAPAVPSKTRRVFNDHSYSSFGSGEPGHTGTEARVVLLAGPKGPNAAPCVVMVEEPKGWKAGWQRFAARLRGSVSR